VADQALNPVEELAILKRVDEIRDRYAELDALCAALSGYFTELMGADETAFFVVDEGAFTPIGKVSPELRATAASLPVDEGWRTRVRGEVHAWALNPSGRLLGALIARTGPALDDAARARADAFILQADSAMAQALTFAELGDRNAELEAIYAIDHIRDQQYDFDEMLVEVMRHVLRVVPGQCAVVGLAQATDLDGRLRLRHVPDHVPLDEAHSAEITTLIREAFAARHLVQRDRLGDFAGALCVPLILHDLIIGGLAVLDADFRPRHRRILSAIASQVDTAIFEDLSRQRIKRIFKRYVADSVVEQMLGDDATDYLKGQRREVTVIFSDLRDFTTVSESLDPDILLGMLNEHLVAMTEIVFRHGGTVDKFIGDCVMAFWGAPVQTPDHARQAVRACLEMRRRHDEMCRDWAARGLPAPRIGIGVNSGEAMVGNIGGERLSSYTVIGDHVNLAARMEGLSGGDDVLITEHTLARLGGDFTVEARGAVVVKGKTVAVQTFNVLEGPSGA
jgi:class 3 adenylate cyclase